MTVSRRQRHRVYAFLRVDNSIPFKEDRYENSCLTALWDWIIKISIGGNNNTNILCYCIVTNFMSCGRPCSYLIYYIIIIYYYIVCTLYIAMYGGNGPMNRQRRRTFRKKNNFRSSLSSRSK